MRILRTATLAHRADQYADKREPATEDTFEIPEDLTQLSDEEIVELHNKATEAFNGIYGDGSELSDDDLVTLSALTEGIEGVKEELATRETAAAERRERAAELAAKVNPADESDEDDEEGAESDDEDSEEAEDAEDASDDAEAPSGDAEEDDDESAAQTVTAAAPKRRRGAVRVDMSQARRHLPKARTEEPRGMRDVVFAAGEGSGYAAGEGIDFADAHGAAAALRGRGGDSICPLFLKYTVVPANMLLLMPIIQMMFMNGKRTLICIRSCGAARD